MKRESYNILIIWISFLIISTSSAHSQDINVLKIQQQLLKMDSLNILKSASWGCVLERLSDSKVIAYINKDKILIPASSLKIAVTYPAWKLLGADYRFQTFIEYDGYIKDSILFGNIYLKGGGDPTLGTSRFSHTSVDTVLSKILKMIQNAGIRHIAGGVIADAEVFDNKLIPSSWSWEDMGNYYGGGVSGLNFNENQVDIVFQPGKTIDDPAKVIRIEPPLQGIEYDNEVVTAGENTGDQVVIYGAPYDKHRVFTGTVPLGKTEFVVKGSLPDPALEFARYLYKYLIINSIDIKFEATSLPVIRKQGNRISESRTRLGMITSPSLLEIIELTHEKSINLYADCLLKILGKEKGKDGSFESGVAVVKMFWREMGLDVSAFIMKDGSGLSVSNRISPALLANMMKTIGQDKVGTDYLRSLNQAGVSGDMKSLFSDGSCVKKIYAKSGYMKTVRAYAGIIKGSKMGDLSFSIIVNHTGNNNPEIKAELKNLMEMFCNCR